MSKTLRNAFLNRVLKGGACIFALFAGAVIFYSTTAESKVCFLPGGLCPGELNSGSYATYRVFGTRKNISYQML